MKTTSSFICALFLLLCFTGKARGADQPLLFPAIVKDQKVLQPRDENTESGKKSPAYRYTHLLCKNELHPITFQDVNAESGVTYKVERKFADEEDCVLLNADQFPQPTIGKESADLSWSRCSEKVARDLTQLSWKKTPSRPHLCAEQNPTADVKLQKNLSVAKGHCREFFRALWKGQELTIWNAGSIKFLDGQCDDGNTEAAPLEESYSKRRGREILLETLESEGKLYLFFRYLGGEGYSLGFETIGGDKSRLPESYYRYMMH